MPIQRTVYRIVLAVVIVVALVLLLASSPEPAPTPSGVTGASGFTPLTICHREGNGTHVEITVASEAVLAAHAQHEGDVTPAPSGGCAALTSTTSPSTTRGATGAVGSTSTSTSMSSSTTTAGGGREPLATSTTSSTSTSTPTSAPLAPLPTIEPAVASARSALPTFTG